MSRSIGRCLLLALFGLVAVPNVLLSAEPARPSADAAHLDAYTKPDGTSYFALSLVPQTPLAAPASSDVIVLFDTSASQMGPYREKALETLRGVLATLAEGDRVQLMAVDLNAIPLTKSFVAPRGPEMKAALAQLEQRVPLGSTDLEAALNAVNESYKAAPANARSAIYIGDGQSNAKLTGVDVPGLIDRLAKNRVAIHSFAVGPNQNVAALAALANQTGGVVMVDGNRISGKEAGAQLTHALHEPIIWPAERVVPDSLTEVYPAHTPPLRTDRDTILVGKGAPNGNFDVQIKGEANGKPVDLKWTVKPAKADDENAYLAQVVDFAKNDGGYSLPTVGSEGLAEVRRSLNMGAHALAQLGRQAAVAGNTQQAQQFVNEAIRRDPNDPTALVLKASLDNGSFDDAKVQLTAAQAPAAGNALPPQPRDGDLLNSVEQADRLVQQKVTTEATVRLSRIRDQMLNDPNGAIQELSLLLDSVLRVPQLTSEQRADLRNRITSLLEQATQRRLAKEVADVQYQQNLAAARERERMLNALERKETQLAGLINRFNSLMDDGYRNFDQLTNEQMRSAARDAAEEFRRADVNPFGRENVASITGPQFAELSTYNIENNAVREAAERNFMDTMHLVDISHIPFPDSPPIVYPDVSFWRKITRDRKKFASVDLASTSPTEQKILTALGDKTKLEFVETPLKEAMTYIADLHKIDIQYDIVALRDAAIDPTAIPVSLSVHDITLRSALKLILSQNNLTYVIQDEVLQITTKDKADATLKTKVYPVGDLVLPIMAIANQQGGGFGLGGGIGGGGGGGGLGGGGGGGFGGGGGGLGGGGGGGLFGGGGGFNVEDDTSMPVPPAGSGGALAVGDDLKLSPPKTNEAKPATVPTSVKLAATAATAQAKPAAAAAAKNEPAVSEQIVVKSDVPPEKFWNDYFVGLSKPDEKHAAEAAAKRNAAVRQVAKELMNDQKFDHVSALIRGALRNGYGQPWMYEALALSMQAENQPKEEIERALMSAVDLANSPSDLMNVAIYMARIGLDNRALKLLRQASDLQPFRHEPYMHGLKIAERLKDSDGIRWACLGVFGQAWPADKKDIVDAARFASEALLEKLRKDGQTAQADDLRKAIDAAKVRDCRVKVTWTGNADIDLTIEEPSGSTCTERTPRTTGGGLLVGDGYANAKSAENQNAEHTQEYILPQGFNGQYKMLLRRLWGQVATGKVTVDVYTHFGARSQVHVRQQIPVSERDAIITFDLAGGRRTEPLEQVQIAAAANTQIAVNQSILAQQLNVLDSNGGTSNSNGVIGAPGTGGDIVNVGGFPFFRRGAVGYQPVLTVLPEGAQMNGVTAVISADRRYVRISFPQNGLFFSSIGPVNTFNFATGQGATQP